MRDLYTSTESDAESDKNERWIQSEFEDPGLEAIEKVAEGRQLKPIDWNRLAWYAFIQDRRTPASFAESMKRNEKLVPEVMERVLSDFASGRAKTLRPRGIADAPNPFEDCFRIQVRRRSGCAEVEAEVTNGRRLWLNNVRYATRPEGPIKNCCEHKWSVAEAADGADWLTSDHPIIRLNYYRPGEYDFGGGWGNPGTELLLPLTPRYLLYTRVGQKSEPRFTCSRDQTRIIQKWLAERASRWIFATGQIANIAELRDRTVDPAAFAQQEGFVRNWATEQNRGEAEWQGGLSDKHRGGRPPDES